MFDGRKRYVSWKFIISFGRFSPWMHPSLKDWAVLVHLLCLSLSLSSEEAKDDEYREEATGFFCYPPLELLSFLLSFSLYSLFEQTSSFIYSSRVKKQQIEQKIRARCLSTKQSRDIWQAARPLTFYMVFSLFSIFLSSYSWQIVFSLFTSARLNKYIQMERDRILVLL